MLYVMDDQQYVPTTYECITRKAESLEHRAARLIRAAQRIRKQLDLSDADNRRLTNNSIVPELRLSTINEAVNFGMVTVDETLSVMRSFGKAGDPLAQRLCEAAKEPYEQMKMFLYCNGIAAKFILRSLTEQEYVRHLAADEI
jgi:hypothetical protein